MGCCGHNEEVAQQPLTITPAEESNGQGSRLAYLLGEMRRQMNGAVADAMRFYGEKYGLNYGVSLPTIRSIARAEQTDHKLAKLLYRQEVRELQLAALWIADSDMANEEQEFWRGGITNSEIAEEAAFALIYRCNWAAEMLTGESELHHYTATLALAKECDERGTEKGIAEEVASHWPLVVKAMNTSNILLPKGTITLLERLQRRGVSKGEIEALISQLPDTQGAKYLREEMAWRLEL